MVRVSARLKTRFSEPSFPNTVDVQTGGEHGAPPATGGTFIGFATSICHSRKGGNPCSQTLE